MDENYVKYSQLFGRLVGKANESDFFSEDGATWNPEADWIKDAKHVYSSREFQNKLLGETHEILNTVPVPDIKDFSEELQKFISRVEERDSDG